MKRTISVLVVLALGFLAGCGGAEGFKDPDRLAGSIKAEAQARLVKHPDGFKKGTTVKDVTCVEGRERIFKCIGEMSTGESYSTTATVSKDGKRYVTD